MSKQATELEGVVGRAGTLAGQLGRQLAKIQELCNVNPGGEPTKELHDSFYQVKYNLFHFAYDAGLTIEDIEYFLEVQDKF